MNFVKSGMWPLFLVGVVLASFSLSSCSDPGPPRVLVFSKTKGWKHTSIPSGIDAILKLGKENGFLVDTTKDASFFDDFNLKQYKAVIFNNTTRNVLNPDQQAAFERFIQAGGGFVGIHSAADTEYEWPWYDKLVGAHFSSHPHNPNVRPATVRVTDNTHMSTSGLPADWKRTDEWYNYRSFYPGLHVVAYLDENTYEGGTNGADHPISWYHEFDGGRAFYTGGGHTEESYSEPLFLKHLLGGIKYAIGDGKIDYRKSYAVTVPEENRFVKTILVNDLNTPMELAVSKDGRIFYTELRTANLGMYNTKTDKYSLVHQFKVCTKGGTGLIGVTLDPDFDSNNFIYLYYAPPTEAEPIMFNLSRFTLTANNTLDTTSEKVLLQVPVQINSGAHHGGSLAWDKEGNLYLSTGDSSSPFPANGYAPLDERPGQEYYSLDAQRGASNTNDLKGKVLRIHPEKDGTYTIPDGNLFPPGTEKTRPEIYAMGCRNPYRIAVNPKTSVLYWGEIGPDAGKDSVQGPRGYDEFNQAKKPGNYGWPYFVGNNQAYFKWDFATNTAGAKFNPAAPVNKSPNNTGLENLPPAQSAMIWYPYASSNEFPELGQGGRSAMAGQFYTYSRSTGNNAFPQYYDGALFVFDWMRNWVLALRFDKNENYVRSEPFMSSNGDFRRPIDLAFGTDGIMYMLEYGSVYGADNEDSRLVKIEFNGGNRAPHAQASIVDSVAMATRDKMVFLTSERRLPSVKREITGRVPLRVTFSSNGTTDPDDSDEFSYEWLFDGKSIGSKTANPAYTFTKAGVYQVVLRVTDKAGAADTDTVVVRAGNAAPVVAVATTKNTSFFWNNEVFDYHVVIIDEEDEPIARSRVGVTFGYNAEPAAMMVGATLMASSDCKACHTADRVSVGPAYRQVAERYKSDAGAINKLADKIIAGGGGNWGTEHVMSAHPQLNKQEAIEIVKYILSLNQTAKPTVTARGKGAIPLKDHKPEESRGVYTLTASYTDGGAAGANPLTTTTTVNLRPAKVRAVYTDQQSGFARFGNNLANGDHKSFLLLKNVDLNHISGFQFEYASKDKAGEIEVRKDSQAGPVISLTNYAATGSWDSLATVSGYLHEPVTGKHDVYFIFKKPQKPNEDIINIKSITFELDDKRKK
ncbi:MAG: ThuA domain-containing protein [Chryseolinea sp.]